MIEIILQEGKTQTGAEWLKAERAVTLTNEQIIGIKAYFDLSQREWLETRNTFVGMAAEYNKDGSLKYPKASRIVADMDDVEEQARAAVNRLYIGGEDE